MILCFLALLQMPVYIGVTGGFSNLLQAFLLTVVFPETWNALQSEIFLSRPPSYMTSRSLFTTPAFRKNQFIVLKSTLLKSLDQWRSECFPCLHVSTTAGTVGLFSAVLPCWQRTNKLWAAQLVPVPVCTNTTYLCCSKLI